MKRPINSLAFSIEHLSKWFLRLLFVGLIALQIAVLTVPLIANAALAFLDTIGVAKAVSLASELAEVKSELSAEKGKRAEIENSLNSEKRRSAKAEQAAEELAEDASLLRNKNMALAAENSATTARLSAVQKLLTQAREDAISNSREAKRLAKENARSELRYRSVLREKNDALVKLENLTTTSVADKKRIEEVSQQNSSLEKLLSKAESSRVLEVKSISEIDRLSKRILDRTLVSAQRNVASMAFESVPGIGVATIFGVTVLEIKDACETGRELGQLRELAGLAPMEASVVQSVCDLTPRFIPSETFTLKQCELEADRAVETLGEEVSREMHAACRCLEIPERCE